MVFKFKILGNKNGNLKKYISKFLYEKLIFDLTPSN